MSSEAPESGAGGHRWAPIDGSGTDAPLGPMPPPPPPPPVGLEGRPGPPLSAEPTPLGGYPEPPPQRPAPRVPPPPLAPAPGPASTPPWQRRSQRERQSSGAWLVVVVVLAAALLTGAFAIALSGDGDGIEAPAASPDVDPDEDTPAASTVGNASQAFAKALRQLEDGGSFRYAGFAHATEATALRPTTVFPEPMAVEGEVALPRRVHELASNGSDTIYESVIVGPGVWERANSVEAGPAAAPPYEEEGRGAHTMGAALLPEWLRTVTDRTEVGPHEAEELGLDEDLRVFGGTLTLPEGTGAVEMYIALGEHDTLTHVWIASAEAPFFVDWEISGIGHEVDIPAPGPLLDAAVDFGPDDLAAAGIARPVQLTQVPEGWVLADGWIEADAPSGGCSTLHLDYQPVDAGRYSRAGADVGLRLEVMADGCRPPGELGDIALTVGGWSGAFWEGGNRCDGTVSDGSTAVRFEADLPRQDVETLLLSLAPFDPEVQPTEVDGLG